MSFCVENGVCDVRFWWFIQNTSLGTPAVSCGPFGKHTLKVRALCSVHLVMQLLALRPPLIDGPLDQGLRVCVGENLLGGFRLCTKMQDLEDGACGCRNGCEAPL
ncbi:unnamed protein product [Ostreobium quekettii]|uniref:Uncharacterized protein n=1 Tax=Ostreobium quekettii TaxID=121088 RepID=A0A8S1J637_9CHLO|nr:unnamed protein product [Ostreobium quekettii]